MFMLYGILGCVSTPKLWTTYRYISFRYIVSELSKLILKETRNSFNCHRPLNLLLRRMDAAVWTLAAHCEAVTGLTLSSQCPGCLVTASSVRLTCLSSWSLNCTGMLWISLLTTSNCCRIKRWKFGTSVGISRSLYSKRTPNSAFYR